MKLKTETSTGEELITQKETPEGTVLEPSYVSYLRTQGYQIEEVNETHTVQSDSDSHSYLVFNISTYLFPRSSPLLDVADKSQQIDVWVCSCPQYRFREGVDVSNGPDVTPEQCGYCKHIEQVDKTIRARQDDSQQTL